MTNDTQTTTESPSMAFGAKLQTAREALGLGTKDAAARLRLNEKVIVMMEKERYADDLPITFIRGYIRAYSKLLQIPDYEVKKALEPIKPKPTISDIELTKNPSKTAQSVSTETYSIKISTYLIAFMVIGLAGAWLYTHNMANDTHATVANESQLLPTPSDTIQSTIPALDAGGSQLNDAMAPANAPTLPTPQINFETKPSTPAASETKPAPTASKPKPQAAPVEEDDEQYVDDDNTD